MSDKNDNGFFDDASEFWKWINDRHDSDGQEKPFLNESDDQPDMGDFDPDDFGDLSDVLMLGNSAEELEGGGYATGAYTIAEISDAIAYCRDAPPGILKMLVLESGEIEIYRFDS